MAPPPDEGLRRERALKRAVLDRAVACGLLDVDLADRAEALLIEAESKGAERAIDDVLAEVGVARSEIEALDPSSALGRTLDGFRLDALLGIGGYGAVYRAEQAGLGRTVAVKVLDPRLATLEQVRERFRREARAAGRLDHPHIIRAIGFGEADGLFYLAQEMLTGGSVADRVEEGPLGERRALEVTRDVAAALAFAAAEGFVHRDIKPANLLFDGAGRVKVADLGFALDTRSDEERLTHKGRAVGSPLYVAPEQARGEADVDPRADIYGLGVTLFEMLSGRVPFDGATPTQVMRKHQSAPLPDLAALGARVSASTRALVERMCAKDPSQRFEPDALVLAIEAILEEHDAAAADAGGPRTAGAGRTTRPGPARRRLGSYELHEELGRGGMGVVYRAHDPRLHRDVALKEVLARGAVPKDDAARFLEEAQTAAQLEHPSIVPVYDGGVGDDGSLAWFTMKLVAGRTLSDILQSLREGDPETRATYTRYRLVQVLVEVAHAVSYAHAKGVVHRDLKPGNIMVGRFAEVHVMDWGLAKLVEARGRESEPSTPRVRTSGQREDTIQGAFSGTPGYMAPEQARGDVAAIGPASDVYALGATLWAICTLQNPYANVPTDLVLTAVRRGPPPAPRRFDPGVPKELDAIAMRALSTEPADRYPSAEALADDLHRWLEGEPVEAYPEGLLARLLKRARRHTRFVLVLAALLLLGLAGSVAALLKIHSERQRADQERDAALAANRLAESERARAERFQAQRERGLSQLFGEMGRRALAANDPFAASRLFLQALAIEDRADVRMGLLEARLRTPRRVAVIEPEGEALLVDRDPTGARLVFACADGSITLCAAADLGGSRQLRGPGASVHDVRFGRDGSRVVAALADGSCAVWDAGSGTTLFQAPAHDGAARAAVLTADGARVVTGGDDSAVRVFSLEDGRRLLELEGHEGIVFGLALSPDGRSLATASEDGIVRRFDLASGEAIDEWDRSDAGWLYTVAFSPDGSLLAAGGDGGRLGLWQLETGARSEVSGLGEAIHLVRFNGDGTLLLIAGTTVRLWDVGTGQARVVVSRGLTPSPVGIALWPDGDRFAVAGFDGTLAVFDVASRAEVRSLSGHAGQIWSVTVDGAKGLVASADTAGAVRLWDARTGEPRGVLLGHEGGVEACAFRPGRDQLASVGVDRTIRVWDTVAKTLAATWTGHTDGVHGIEYSPDGTIAGSVAGDGELRLWNADDGSLIRKVAAHRGTARALAFAPDGTRVATAGSDRAVRIWTLDGELQRELLGHEAEAEHVTFDRTGERIASSSWDGTVRIWRVADGALLHTLPHDGWVYAASFSSDGTLIATAPESGSLDIFRTDTGERWLSVPAHFGETFDVTFAGPDAIFTVGTDRTVKRWDLTAVRRWLEDPAAELQTLDD